MYNSSIYKLLYEFKNPQKGTQKLNKEICHERLRALILVTVSFINALRYAFNKLY